MSFLFHSGIVFACSLGWALGQPIITEFLASNSTGLRDEDNDASDWIEIYNPAATTLDLDGWYLTDNATQRTKWQIPAVTLQPNGYLIIFASSKNRADPAAPLHTNFGLSAGGEYLGLVQPGGVVIASEYAPSFPAQQADVSYGITQPVEPVMLLGQGSTARGLIPTDTSDAIHGSSWRETLFNDSDWLSGTLGFGYNFPGLIGLNVAAMANVNGSAYLRAPLTITNPSEFVGLSLSLIHDDGFAAWLNGAPIGSRLAPDLDSLAWNSLATKDRSNPLTEGVTFDLTSVLPTLISGQNMLALHALNWSLASSDLLLLPTLTAFRVSSTETPQQGYFALPTPGIRNGGAASLILPQRVIFSPTSGTFTTTRTVTLAGADTAAGQRIRYVLTAPSANGATPVEPNFNSPLYTGPITVSNSQIISAAVFDAADSRRGLSAFSQHLALQTTGANRTDNFTSALPLTVLNLHGFGALSDNGIYRPGWIHQFAPASGPATLVSPPTLASRGELRIRGSSSAGFPKKSYNLEVHDERGASRNLPLLGLPADDDWAMIGSWLYDKSHIHNAFIYEMSRRIGRYAPRTRFTEVFSDFNGNRIDHNDYAGIYAITERIQVGSQRVAIAPLNFSDLTAPAITGGYILKIDRADPDEYSWRTSRGFPTLAIAAVVVHSPELADLAPQQQNYIRNYVQAMEDALFMDSAASWTTRNHLDYLDRDSWVDHHLLNVLAKNVDGLRLSAYFHKNRGGKIIAGPAWDFDRSLGSSDGRDANPIGWNGTGDGTDFWNFDWWGVIARDPDFQQAWIDRWQTLRASTFAPSEFNLLIDQLSGQIGGAAAARDAAKWPANAFRFNDYAGEINHMKNWLATRAAWIDGQFVALPVITAPAATTRILTPASGETIIYTTDGTDPRLPGGAKSPTAFTLTSPVRFDGALALRARVLRAGAVSFPGSRWSGLLTADVAAPIGFTGWAAARLPGLTPAEQAADADPDGDGYVNLIEYALDFDPATSDTSRNDALLSSAIIEEGPSFYIDYTYRQRLDRTTVTLRVETSNDLGLTDAWTTVADTRLDLTGAIETRLARINIDTASRVFIRLVATVQ